MKSKMATLVSMLLILSACRAKEPTLVELTKMRLQEAPNTVSFEIQTYCSGPYTPGLHKDFFASNLSARPHRGLLQPDSDSDGVVDVLERENAPLGLATNNAYTASPYFGDLLIYLSGILPVDQSRLRCVATNDQTDADNDGLLACEERRLTHTESDLFDTDGDSIPDGIELRCGLNAKDPADAVLDPDNDGVNNADECKANTPVNDDNGSPSVKQIAYQYRTERDERPGVVPCMRFYVDNVPILPAAGQNLVRFSFVETNLGTSQKQLVTFDQTVAPALAGKPGARIVCNLDLGANNTLQGGCRTQ